MLDDGSGGFVVYNHMQFEEEGKHAEFLQFWLHWDERTDEGQRARAKYLRETNSEESSSRKERSLQFYDTDYHSYAVGVSCLENEAGD